MVRDGRYVIRGHVIEVRDGKQLSRNNQWNTDGPALQEPLLNGGRDEAVNRPNAYTSHAGILYAMNSLAHEEMLYHREPANDRLVAASPGRKWLPRVEGNDDGRESGLGANVMTGQEKLRAGAVANGGPKLAFIDDIGPQQELPEGVLPCIMGRESPVGSITSLDSLDEVPHEVGPAPEEERDVIESPSILTKGSKRMKSPTRRRVRFSDSIEFDDGVTGQLVTEEKQSTKVYTKLYARNAKSVYASSPSTAPSRPESDANDSKSTSRQKGTLQEGADTVKSFTGNNGKEVPLSMVTHWDYPKASSGSVPNKMAAKNLNAAFSSSRWSGPQEPKFEVGDIGVFHEHVLSDSLEETSDREPGGNNDKETPVETEVSSAHWSTPLRPSMVKDSLELEHDVQRIWHVNSDDGALNSESAQKGCEPLDSSRALSMDSPNVPSGSQWYEEVITREAPVVNSASYVHQNTQTNVDVPDHQNFIHSFYTGAGTEHLQVSETSQRLATKGYWMPSQVQLGASSHYAGVRTRDFESLPGENVLLRVTDPFADNFAVTTQTRGSQTLRRTEDVSAQSGDSNKNRISTKSQTISSPERSSSLLNSKPSRSLIPRPPASKKSGRGRTHPANHLKRKDSVRLHKAAAATNTRTIKKEKVYQVSNIQKPVDSLERSTHSKYIDTKSREGCTDNGDDIFESIERNMEKINLRARTTAAEEERQRIVNSLRLQFDNGHNSQPKSATELIFAERSSEPEYQARRVHDPRAGSAGQRGSKGAVGDNAIGGTRSTSNSARAKNGTHDMAFVKNNSQNPSSSPSVDVVQNPAVEIGRSKPAYCCDRDHDIPTSTVALSTNSGTTVQIHEGSSQARVNAAYGLENSELQRSMSLDRTPTDEEINHLWAHVRSYLHSSSTQSAGSDSCVNRINVRRSRTSSGSTHQPLHQHAASLQKPHDSPVVNGHIGVTRQNGGSTLGGLRRYGSHEVLRRHSSSDSISYRRSPLLQQRAVRSRRLQIGKPPLPRQHQHNPAPSQGGPSASLSSRGE